MFLMFIGYSLLEMAQVRPKNQNHVLTKNMIIFTVSLVTFFLIGYGIAFGGISAGVVGG
jgi:Amt family ammonium transporter